MRRWQGATRPGLAPRVLGATVVLVLAFVASLAMLLDANRSLERATMAEEATEGVLLALARIDARLNDYDGDFRGFLAGHDEEFPREAPRLATGLRSDLRALVALERVDGDPGEPEAYARLGRQIESYLRRSAAVAERDLSRREADAAARESDERVEAISAALAPFVSKHLADARRERAQATGSASRAARVAWAGLGLVALLSAAFAAYLLRLFLRPVRHAAAAAQRLAAGDLSARVLEQGAGEISDLARSFNAMAASLQDSQGRLKRLASETSSILDAAGDGILGMDAHGRATFVNRMTGELTGHAPDELVGRVFHDVVHHTREDGTPYPIEECPISATGPEGVPHRGHDLFWRRNGTSFPVEYASTPLFDDGRPAGAVIVFRDVTEQCELERRKREFTSIVSHELRTPLTSIRGSFGLLAGGALGAVPQPAQRMLDIAVANSDRLVRLANDILDMERIESGKVAMRMDEVRVADLTRRAAEAMEGMAHESRVALETESADGSLAADPDRIMQVLTNLVSNAIKFSPPGGTVWLRSKRHDADVVFEVRDQGRGLPPEKLAEIFEPFHQVDASDAREKGGTGLGLAICRSIVERHGGRIWATSSPGEGATFRFTLPAHAAATAPAGGAPGPAVLVCDDDPDVREVVGGILARRGYRPILTSSGAETVERAALEQPTAILLDLLMPKMSGWATADALKRHPETRRIPIIVLSALASHESEIPGVEIHDWVAKPIEEGSLFAALDEALGHDARPRRVLIVEDDDDLADVLETSFRRHQLTTCRAGTGGLAVELARHFEPDLLVVDLGLPDGDGLAVIEQLRDERRLDRVPVIVYTGHKLSAKERERLRRGEIEIMLKASALPEDVIDRATDLLARIAEPQRATA